MEKGESPASISGKLIINPTVRKAIDALQRGEVRIWLSLFVRNAVLYDHGNAMTATEFIEKSVGREWFTRIDRTEDAGLSVFGSYHTVQWGDFPVRFLFLVDGGKISRLELSQVAY
jgi:hypothetical protein